MAMMEPARIDLVIYQGATYWEEWTWLDSDQDAIDLTNYLARMQIREEVESDVKLIDIASDNGNADQTMYIGGKVEQNPQNGKYGIWLAAGITEAIQWESGVYDIELVASDGYVRRIQEGKVRVKREVTRP